MPTLGPVSEAGFRRDAGIHGMSRPAYPGQRFATVA
jgi:hypothetical protein